MDLKKHIGLKIKHARQKKGWTQQHFADRLSKAVETVSNIERGSVFTGLETLEQMGKLLGVPMVYFFEGAEHSRSINASQAQVQLEAKALIDRLSRNQLAPVVSMLEKLAEQSGSKSSG